MKIFDCKHISTYYKNKFYNLLIVILKIKRIKY